MVSPDLVSNETELSRWSDAESSLLWPNRLGDDSVCRKSSGLPELGLELLNQL
jgi:hypothetical protein